MAISVFNKNAAAYEERFMDVSLYKPSLDLFCNGIAAPDARILDIACGPGNVTKYILQQRPGFRVLGIDLSENMLALARKNNPGADFRRMDCGDILQTGQQYDGVLCSFCLPYLSKEEASKLVKDVAALLRPGGMFYISTMEDDYSRSGIQTTSSGDRLYMYYHHADHLVPVLEENGLSIIELRRQSFPANDDTDLLILAKK